MSLDANRWAAAISGNVSATGLEASEIAQIDGFWLNVTAEHVAEITNNALVTTTSGAPNSEHQGNVS